MTQDLQHSLLHRGLGGRGGQGGILFLQTLAQILLFKNTLFFLSEFLFATVLFVCFISSSSVCSLFFEITICRNKKASAD